MMKKFNDIFSIDSSTGGGKRLIKKIINKYRLGNEYKEIKENIENKGGSSDNAVYYKYKIDNFENTGEYKELIQILEGLSETLLITEYSYVYDNYHNYYYYNRPIKYQDPSIQRIYGISVIYSKVNNNGIIFNFNSLEEFFNVNVDNPEMTVFKELFYQYFELSTKEEIEKVMDELINQ